MPAPTAAPGLAAALHKTKALPPVSRQSVGASSRSLPTTSIPLEKIASRKLREDAPVIAPSRTIEPASVVKASRDVGGIQLNRFIHSPRRLRYIQPRLPKSTPRCHGQLLTALKLIRPI